MTKRLIVNADDYGRSAGVVKGILQAHREGIVTSSTAMMNMPDIENALQRVEACPHLGLGVHLVFSAWRPVSPPGEIPTLVDREGAFLKQEALWERRDTIDLNELRVELTAQIERFQAMIGHTPDHLDCHHFIHLYPPFFGVYVDLAAEFALPIRTPFPVKEALSEAMASIPLLEGVPSSVVWDIIQQDKQLVDAKKVRHPDLYISQFFGQGVFLGNLLSILEGLPEGVSELMCHPGFMDERLTGSTYTWQREREVALLCHPRVREKIAELGIELVTFSEIEW